MYRHIIKKTTIALGTLLVSATLVGAASVPGTVTARDGKGMATVRTSDGKDHQVKLGDAFTVGTKVECETKNSVMECHQVHAARCRTVAVLTDAVELRVVARALEPLRRVAERHAAAEVRAALVERDDPRVE